MNATSTTSTNWTQPRSRTSRAAGANRPAGSAAASGPVAESMVVTAPLSPMAPRRVLPATSRDPSPCSWRRVAVGLVALTTRSGSGERARGVALAIGDTSQGAPERAAFPVRGAAPSVSVLLPAYNEAENLAELVPEIGEVLERPGEPTRSSSSTTAAPTAPAASMRALRSATCAASGCAATPGKSAAPRRRARARAGRASSCSWTPTARTTPRRCPASSTHLDGGPRPGDRAPRDAQRPVHQARPPRSSTTAPPRKVTGVPGSRLQQRPQGDDPRAGRDVARALRRAPPLHPGARGAGTASGSASSTSSTTSGCHGARSSAGPGSGGASSTSSPSGS